MRNKTITTTIVSLAIVCAALCGCSSLDKLYSTSTTVTPPTTNQVVQVTPPVTNQVVQVTPPATNAVTGAVTPPITNVIVTVSAPVTNLLQVVMPATTNVALVPSNAVSSGIQAAGSLPLPFAGAGALALGWLYSAYAAFRNKKLASALVTGIEAGRQILQTTPEGQKLDAKVKDALIQHQELAGVLNQASQLVNNLTGNTVGQAS